MYRRAFPWVLFGLLLAGLANARGDQNLTLLGEKGTYLGALFSMAPGPNGVRITHVLPGSPAALAGLQRDDLLLRYDNQRIRDPEHLARLIRDDRPGRTVRLVLNREGREQLREARLTLGPALNLPDSRPDPRPGAKNRPPVTISATPLKNGEFRVTIEYTAKGKPQTITCEGGAELASVVQKLPERERNMARAALQKLEQFRTPPRTTSPSEKR